MAHPSFHNQISAALEYSYESEFNVPLIGKAWDSSFRACADGSNGSKELSTFRSESSEESGVDIVIPSIAGVPNIKTYLYWGKAEYLVWDYQTQPNPGAGSWGLYEKPDPALILPWYGFPDPDTGDFPSPRIRMHHLVG